jgi:hypothetical protein
VKENRWWFHGMLGSIVLFLVMPAAGSAAAQSQPVRPAEKATAAVPGPAAVDEDQQREVREQLFKLLRLSPKMTTVIARDPSLLGNLEYVSRNNPELTQFLQNHPEIARNPEFYLFSNPTRTSGRFDPALRLEQEVWPHLYQSNDFGEVPKTVAIFIFFACILSALIWLLRVLLENRRWGRMLKIQTDVHGKLLDKFTSNEELLAYMGTDAGKRFLEATPIAPGIDAGPFRGNIIGRILLPAQVGVVLALLGAGFFYLRGSIPGTSPATVMLVLGTLALMLGLGFILAAALSWVLAQQFDLLPPRASGTAQSGARADTMERR